MSKMSKSKGQRAEYAAAAILQTIKDEVAAKYGVTATRIVRNLEQTRGGGFDLTECFNYAVEVKHHETFCLNDWWEQTVRQCPDNMIPVLMYKKNNVPFRVRTYAYVFVGTKRVRIVSDMDLTSFQVIFRLTCEHFYAASSTVSTS